MSKSRSGLFTGTKGLNKFYAGNISYMSEKDNYYVNIQKRKDIDPNGCFDIIAHGSNKSIQINQKNGAKEINHRVLYKLLKNNINYKKGQPVRLLSCNTGNGENSFAQNLANKLNTIVIAPTKYAFVNSHGYHFVAGSKNGIDPDYSDIGKYKTFYPNRRK